MTMRTKRDNMALPVVCLTAAILALQPSFGQQPAEPASAPATTEKMYDLKFSSAPLDQVLTFYSELTGRTRLEMPNIKASITLRSQTKLTRDETLHAIKAILAMNNIGLVEFGTNFVKVVPITSVSAEGQSIRSNVTDRVDQDVIVNEVIRLQYIDVNEAQKAIQGMLHPYGKILPLERINSLLITETELNINRMLDIIRRIDQPTEKMEQLLYTNKFVKASEIKAKLIEIFTEIKGQEKPVTPTVVQPRPSGPPGVIRAPRPVTSAMPTVPGVTSEELEEVKLIRGDVRIVADDRTGILIIITLRDNFPFFEKIIKSLDVPVEPEVSVKVFPLEYAEADKVAELLNSLIGAAQSKESSASGAKTPAPKPGQPTPLTPSGGTATQPTESRAAAIEEFLRQQREASHITSQTSEEIRFRVGELSASNIKILPDKRSNTLIVMATNRDMQTLSKIIESVDIMLSQVLIEGVILSITLGKDLQTGIDWFQRSMIAYNKQSDGSKKAVFAFAGGSASSASGTKTVRDATTMTATDSSAIGSGLTYYFTHYGINMDAVVKLSASDNRTRVLSSPIILTTDNKEAKISVATEEYVYKGQTPISTGGTVAYQPNVETRKVGIILTVTPHINQKKFVVMDIVQKVEDVVGEQVISKDQGSFPIIASRELSASIAVRSGETIVFGGLAKETKKMTHSKIPILGDIPLIRLLFSSTDKSNKREELLVFITPRVLDTPEEIEKEARRRQTALGENGRWERTWSDSKLADEPVESKDYGRSGKKKLTEADLLKAAASTNRVNGAAKPAP